MNGRVRALSSTALATLAAAALSVVAPASALADQQTPPDTGCPTAYSLLSVAQLTSEGYRLPAQIDDPANGGNDDGWVCGKPVEQHAATHDCGGPCPRVIYEFRDDTLTPTH